jgi:hypothetical protein
MDPYLEHPRFYFVYPILLARRLPVIAVPLLPEDKAVAVDLQSVFNKAYDAGPYRRRIHYGADPIDPPLRPEQSEWAQTISGRIPDNHDAVVREQRTVGVGEGWSES